MKRGKEPLSGITRNGCPKCPEFSSQFFITHVPTPWLDGKHTVFGSVCSSEDLGIVNKITQGDLINSISIEGDINELIESQKERVEQWNMVLQR